MKTASVDDEPRLNAVCKVASSRDLAELVKARLTLLVLLTTAVGYYLGALRPLNYARLLSCRVRNGARRCRRGGAQSMVGTPSRRAHVANKNASDSGRSHAAA